MSLPAGTVGLITGTGLYDLPDLAERRALEVTTEHGTVEVATGRWGDVAIAHLPRHGRGHARLSHQVAARANVAALAQLGVVALVSTTVCGAVDPTLALGELIVFDDLHFPSNRLPDGSLCTLFTRPDTPGRGHWVYERPIAPEVRRRLLEGVRSTGSPVRDGGTYGHVDGPRFNTRSEIAQLAALGVSAVSQTAGPEVVLAGEARLPFALLGFVTDHANGVSDPPTPPQTVERMFRSSATVIAAALRAAVPGLADPGLEPAGVILPL
ncbi:MAG TPA: MTAP family purine nucleoside phosphorylase [Miltoncostaeaceae bacterium]|nr:MTAP family purine nucleoside phosphorylase [Miltoncostaeaceae bacterium]